MQIAHDVTGTDTAEGQYVLTATDALQFAYDATGALRQSAAPAALSRFTGWLVDAIGKGDAAPDEDRITLDAVFDYLSRRARAEDRQRRAHERRSRWVIWLFVLLTAGGLTNDEIRAAPPALWHA